MKLYYVNKVHLPRYIWQQIYFLVACKISYEICVDVIKIIGFVNGLGINESIIIRMPQLVTGLTQIPEIKS